jgi:hypothetical protein
MKNRLFTMTIVACSFLSLSSIVAQDKSTLYEFDFHRNFVRKDLYLSQKDFRKLVPVLSGKNEIVAEQNASVHTSFNLIQIFCKESISLKRMILRCDDCQREYYLIYISKGNFSVIDATTPELVLIQIFRSFSEDGVQLLKEEVQLLVKEAFFYFEYNQYHSNYAGRFRLIPKK